MPFIDDDTHCFDEIDISQLITTAQPDDKDRLLTSIQISLNTDFKYVHANQIRIGTLNKMPDTKTLDAVKAYLEDDLKIAKNITFALEDLPKEVTKQNGNYLGNHLLLVNYK